MVNYCKHCGKDLFDLKSYQKGGHISNCNQNPNYDETTKKRKETKSNNQQIKNPILKIKLNCLNCNNEFEIEVTNNNYRKGKYKKCCSLECSSKYSSKFNNYEKIKLSKCKICKRDILISNTHSDDVYCDICRLNKKSKIFINNKWICTKCGDEKCKRPNVCRKLQQKNNLFEKYLGFNSSKKRTIDFYNEFDRIVEKLKKDYFENELSLTEIGKKYNMNYQSVQTLFVGLKINIRTAQDGLNLAITNGKINYDNFCSTQYKQGIHTTWDNRQVHYRSSYEKDYYEKLDEQKIFYEVEKLRLIYFDTQKNKRRIAIPDIFIPNENLIIEIKSTWTHDEQNWKDRLKAYKKLKYKVKLVIGDDRKKMKEINY
jgi:hypothetical protein